MASCTSSVQKYHSPLVVMASRLPNLPRLNHFSLCTFDIILFTDISAGGLGVACQRLAASQHILKSTILTYRSNNPVISQGKRNEYFYLIIKVHLCRLYSTYVNNILHICTCQSAKIHFWRLFQNSR
jgi:hypothetical protein